jgi:catechol 2,3-dioxygenase-like lactoylglutathione lyase family enzyme
MSLTESPVAVMLATTDHGRAREFYAGRLGLVSDGVNQDGELMFQLAGGSELVLRELPDARPSANTALSFEVVDIAAEIRGLEERGVTFEDYDTPDLKTVDHIYDGPGMRAAWFHDPDGNVLCLHQPTS